MSSSATTLPEMQSAAICSTLRQPVLNGAAANFDRAGCLFTRQLQNFAHVQWVVIRPSNLPTHAGRSQMLWLQSDFGKSNALDSVPPYIYAWVRRTPHLWHLLFLPPSLAICIQLKS